MGFYPPEVLIGDARRHRVPVQHPDANYSLENCTLESTAIPGEELAIRLGLRYVHGLGEACQKLIVERRGDQPFQSLSGFCRRTRIPRSLVENLIRAGALDNLEFSPGDENRVRRDLLWQLGGLVYQEEDLDLDAPVIAVDLPPLSPTERMAWEYELMGMAPGDQVMSLYREALQARGVLSSEELNTRRDGEIVRVAGWPVVRQRPPTAKGVLFVTLEDETGLMNLIVRSQVYDKYQAALRNAPLLWAEGRLQREGLALSILVNRAASLGASA
jgi:error-prone DNA polymerase